MKMFLGVPWDGGTLWYTAIGSVLFLQNTTFLRQKVLVSCLYVHAKTAAADLLLGSSRPAARARHWELLLGD